MFLKKQMIILEWFLEDYMTLNNGVMATQNSALALQKNKNENIFK